MYADPIGSLRPGPFSEGSAPRNHRLAEELTPLVWPEYVPETKGVDRDVLYFGSRDDSGRRHRTDGCARARRGRTTCQ
ncbi:hypothetical protein NSPZN2_50251 [Nitrospira defluvii]|uniref:Uncharacterized protein n=1 Tax=Nitrospira defluvii TaxID=330214 RepID=A0ABM8S4N6_9BACT|nr:hypothetical protein NSPZN2_50251 [Nitrospira defluvii]